jgi:hypothetical protein
MRQRRYPEALALLDREGFAEAPITEKITYDLLSVLVNGKRSGPLLCEPILKQYPDAYSYSIRICAALVSARAEGRVDPRRLADVREFFEHEKIRKPELLTAVEDLPR